MLGLLVSVRNAYDDYFADFFKKSYENNPKYQRDAGD